ncbi:MAG: PEP-CTERM sorting domain-containing protein [Planctomycetes bacterium]|nr:PEP-CTERM sorting domain-containing protein [Planctomycetota bacterium]
MIKKAEILLSLMLVISMASSANAAMVLELRHGDGDTLEIYATSGYTIGDDIDFYVFGHTSEVMVSGGTVGVLEPIGPVPKDTEVYDDVPFPPQWNGFWGWIGTTAPTTSAGVGTYILNIDWSLVGGATEAEIRLCGAPDNINFYTLSTITVPEPATVLLLTLGSLLLTRRRR